ncbi:MAG: DNA repair protein RecN [Acidihalobacter sp.]|uniref:DNA repair protein RecN n=1 Tax=Acidihalobacter sp. TaxID=1872108 RepID=UPI00307F35F2
MLTHILIRDFAIIDRLELDLEGGMTALTGETGAGKSILVDAIGLVLGDRADSSVVRAGRERAEISATLDLADVPDAQTWLAERDLDTGEECVVRRVIGQDGRSRAYLNGSPATLQMLRELGEQLVSIHGQHAHQVLGHRDHQRDILDLQAGHADALLTLAGQFRAWQRLRERLDAMSLADDQRQERLDFLTFQVDELQTAAPVAGEFAELSEQHERLAHAGQLLENVQQTHSLLFDGEPDVHSLLTQALGALEEAGRHDAALGASVELLRNAQIEIDEAAGELRHYLDGLQLDPERLDAVETRIAQLQSLARKHRCEPEELAGRLNELSAELDGLAHADARRIELAAELETSEATWRTQADAISAARRNSAATLERSVTEAMQTLGMEGGRFSVEVTSTPDGPPTAHGCDRIEFKVSANPGQPQQALAKVASGGELSRISLAIQLAATHDKRIPTLIFDEVDSGIGGGVAEVVGRMLRSLGSRHQVLCVTHLPQVAAQAHHHLAVSKVKGSNSTQTQILRLAEPATRIEELARMLGGMRMTEQTRAHAKEMLRIAQADA